MSIAVTCTKVARADGNVYVRWSDGAELEFGSVNDARQYVRDMLNDAPAVRDLLRTIGIAKLLKMSADGANVTHLEGKTITLDLSLAANLVRIT